MSNQHRATPEQWQAIEANGHLPTRSTILELLHRVEALEGAQHAHVEPPPLGLMPRWLADEKRLADLDAALQRYKDANLQPPHQWLEERQDLLYTLRRRKSAKPTALRPLEVETTYGEAATTAQQILKPRMVVEGTFDHGGETYRFEAPAERENAMDEIPTASAEAQSNHPAKPDSSLVERVANTLRGVPVNPQLEARAAIRAVAAWLREQSPYGIGAYAQVLEEEAKR